MQQNLSDFHFVGNDLAMDFANTMIASPSGPVDLIETADQLVRWLGKAGIETSAGRWSAQDLSALKSLRSAIKQVLKFAVQGGDAPSAAFDTLNAHLRRGHAPQELTFDTKSHHFVIQDSTPTKPPAAVMAELALATASLLTESDLKRIKACANPECVLMFKDISKGGRRRWCSMDTCGNRSKAATFRKGS